VVLAAAIAVAAAKESLWVDELHTAWVLFGDGGNLAERAASGNQTLGYFWVLWGYSQTLGWFWQGSVGPNLELSLRLPSIAAWIGAILWVGRYCRGLDKSLFVFPMLWITVDRIQWFYATEARPYAVLELLSVVGWCFVDSLRANDESKSINDGTVFVRSIVAWAFVAAIAIQLHLTAGLLILVQWIFGCWLLRRRALPLWTMAGTVVLLTALPLVRLAWPVWQRREQWESFASDISFTNTLSLFPFLSLLLPVVVAVCLDRFSQPRHTVKGKAEEPKHSVLIWCFAAGVPILIAWTITALGVAPIYHRRFLIGSALPLVIIAFLQLAKIRNRGLRITTAITVTLAMVISQGTFDMWRHGVFVGKLRNEDWRSAAAWIAKRSQSTDLVFCSSGLIEANLNELPLSDATSKYLSFPLRSIYRVNDRELNEIEVIGLVQDESLWHLQLTEVWTDKNRAWIVYRGALQRFEAKLRTLQAAMNSNLRGCSHEAIQRFGNVYVVQFSCPGN
jgi:mannosyltransferase